MADYQQEAAAQRRRTEAFRALHHTGETLVLPNAWDGISAKIFEMAGFAAVATTSSGVSFAQGVPDGEHLDPERLIEVVGRMTSTVGVPLTVDIEAGYSQGDIARFRAFIARVLDAGAVGINLEDGSAATGSLRDLKLQQELIRQARAVAEEKEFDLFINARTDALRFAPGTPADRIGVALQRAAGFREAGADGIFVPFVSDLDTVAALKGGLRLPLNILINQHLEIRELRRLGVNRVSTGSGPILATLGLLVEIAAQLKSSDDWSALYHGAVPYPQANAWLKRN